MRIFSAIQITISILILIAGLAAATASENVPRVETESGLPAMPTLGGRQFWGDVYAHAGWRIQENVFTGHFRLLDPDNARYAWGGYRQCREAIDEISRRNDLHWENDHLVVMVHGLARNNTVFDDLTEVLRADGYSTLAVSYPSTRGTAAEHARRLNRLIGDLKGIKRVSFVTHSFGGLVLRLALSTGGAWQERLEVNSAILVAPPNQGSAIADFLKDFWAFRLIAGQGGQAVTSGLAQQLPVPPFPLGVIAGGRNDGKGFNPLLKGDDDGIVSVEETRLEGAADFLLVEAIHTFIMNNPLVAAAVRNFLRAGRFDPDDTLKNPKAAL